ncbi:MAG: ribosome biogenesis GTPase YlqF [Pseudomonadota bacterium]
MIPIQWFPGHMLETEQFLKKTISRVDVVLEVLDARLPVSSSNPLMDKLCHGVSRLKLLNKNDLADPDTTASWIAHFRSGKGVDAIAITGTDEADVWRAADQALKGLEKKPARRARIMVVGIPNTGKSTIMNTLAGKKIAKTGNTPAITRHLQRATLKNHMDIYDTPGVLWPVFRDQTCACRLAVSGAISDAAIDYNDIACFFAAFLIDRYPHLLTLRYRLNEPVPREPVDLVEAIGIARGCIRKGGVVDFQKASGMLIREFRDGKIGRISLERPEDFTDTPEMELTSCID